MAKIYDELTKCFTTDSFVGDLNNAKGAITSFTKSVAEHLEKAEANEDANELKKAYASLKIVKKNVDILESLCEKLESVL